MDGFSQVGEEQIRNYVEGHAREPPAPDFTVRD